LTSPALETEKPLLLSVNVNGDGLDDLIVGAPYANLSGRIDAGKSYVVFGKTDTNHRIYLRLIYRLDQLYEH
jgi:hypothetical protein